MAGVLAAQVFGNRSYAGPMGKSDRAAAMSVISIAIGSGLTPGYWSDIMLLAINVLLGITIINRCRAPKW
jgi:CDP-diacylglycerol--glycerol-3-phosphate 3-phosphatidyltransferase